MNPRDEILRRLRTGRLPSSPSDTLPPPRQYADLETGIPQNPLQTFIEIFNENHGYVRQFSSSEALRSAWPTLQTKLPAPRVSAPLPIELPTLRPCQRMEDIYHAQTAFTACRALIAQTGCVLITAAEDPWRALSVYPPIHVVIAFADQLVPTLDDALRLTLEHTSYCSFIGGPSRTADIEKTLVLGAHGPKRVEVWIVDK